MSLQLNPFSIAVTHLLSPVSVFALHILYELMSLRRRFHRLLRSATRALEEEKTLATVGKNRASAVHIISLVSVVEQTEGNFIRAWCLCGAADMSTDIMEEF